MPSNLSERSVPTLGIALSEKICDTINLLDFCAPRKEHDLIGAHLLKCVHRVQELLCSREQRGRFGCGEGREGGIVVQNILPSLFPIAHLKRDIDLSNEMGRASPAGFLPALLNRAKRLVNLFALVCSSDDAIRIARDSLDGARCVTTKQQLGSMRLSRTRPNWPYVGANRLSSPDAFHLLQLLFQPFAAMLIWHSCSEIVIFSPTKTKPKGETAPGKKIQGRAFLGKNGGIAYERDQDFCHQTNTCGESCCRRQRHEWFKIRVDHAIKDTEGGKGTCIHPSDPFIKMVR